MEQDLALQAVSVVVVNVYHLTKVALSWPLTDVICAGEREVAKNGAFILLPPKRINGLLRNSFSKQARERKQGWQLGRVGRAIDMSMGYWVGATWRLVAWCVGRDLGRAVLPHEAGSAERREQECV